jgi:hypothetical protein
MIFICQILTLLNIKKERTIQLSSYSIIFYQQLKSLNYDMKVFKPALKDSLLTHTFYSVDDFLSAENS